MNEEIIKMLRLRDQAIENLHKAQSEKQSVEEKLKEDLIQKGRIGYLNVNYNALRRDAERGTL